MRPSILVLRSFVLVVLSFSAVVAQPATTGFKDTDALLQLANDAEAALLAPASYARAEKNYESARKHSAAGRQDASRKSIVKANAGLREAINAANLAAVVFKDSLAARDRANDANAALFEPALWAVGEKELAKAAKKLESGRRKSAQAEAIKSAESYGVAELAAIKTGIVGNARILIAEAEASSNKVSRNAPITLAQAKSLVALAEATIDGSRYSVDEPKALAAAAEYEAKHSIYIASQAAMIGARKISVEELMLQWEKPLLDLAAALQVKADLTAGFETTASEALAQANKFVAQYRVASPSSAKPLESSPGATPETMEQRLAKLEALLPAGQAQVMIEGGDMVLRLNGLQFVSGQSALTARHFDLLEAVQQSLELFPEAYFVVAGHVDALGTDEEDLILSQKRANSVRSFLVRNPALQATRVSAEGYGASQPLAANATVDGRAQNRRVEIIIRQPKAAAGQRTANLPN